MRQMTAHIAYAITGGTDCMKVHKMRDETISRPLTHFLFFNRFFGFGGDRLSEDALQLKAIETLQPIEFGSKPYPALDRRLWTLEKGMIPEYPSLLKPIFEELHVRQSKRLQSRLRQQIRRFFYFFGDMPDDLESFPAAFIDSPMLIELEQWQQNSEALTLSKNSALLRKVLHVLQEQFTGFHLPENTRANEIYITLNRKNDDLRQSVQIVMAKIPFSNFTLSLDPLYKTIKPIRRIIILEEKFSHVKLSLDLPFLDFMMKRHKGEIGEGLNASYAQRLEKFKARLLFHYSLGNHLELLELKNTGEFSTKSFIPNKNILEVA